MGTGPRVPFRYHKDTPFPHSEYLNSCFGWLPGRVWAETETRLVRLEEQDPVVFRYVDEWIRARDIQQVGDNWDPQLGNVGPDALMMIEIWKLTLYLFALGVANFDSGDPQPDLEGLTCHEFLLDVFQARNTLVHRFGAKTLSTQLERSSSHGRCR